MLYNNNAHIRSVEDVEAFFHYLVYERKVNLHPDDDFNEFVNYEENKVSFTSDEASVFNRLMRECFDVCEKENADIYEIGYDVLQRFLKQNVS